MHYRHLTVATALLVFTSTICAQNCPAGTHISRGWCCRDGTEYQGTDENGTCCPYGTTYMTEGNQGSCCPTGTKFMTDNGQKGTCCLTSPEGFKNEGGQCVRRWESSHSSSWQSQSTLSFWQQYSSAWFEWRGQRIEIADHGGRSGFLVNGYFYEYRPGGITIGGSTFVVGQGGILTVDGNQVQVVGGSGDQKNGARRVSGSEGGISAQSQEKIGGSGTGGTSPLPGNGSGGDSSRSRPGDNKDGSSGSQPAIGQGQGDPAFRPKDVCDSCAKGYVCGCTGKHLGIKYGHCYNIEDVNGLPLNRDAGGTYSSGSDVGNLVFRICKSTADCSEAQGVSVPEGGTWSLQDQLGWKDWKGPAFIGTNWPHFAINKRDQAVNFTAESLCMYGDCSLCLRDGEKGRGMTAPCPLGQMAPMAHLYYTTNPNSCKAYRFRETQCLKNDNEAEAKKMGI